MAKELFVVSYCDYPGCKEEFIKEHGVGIAQETSTATFWFYANGKGRKTSPITIDLCEHHTAELRGLFTAMQKFDQKEQ